MAKITVTTDEGEVMNVWQDSRDEIGDVSKRMAAVAFMEDLAHEIKLARLKDGRKADGTKGR